MRVALVLISALALTSFASAQDADTYVWPVPEISSDLSVLPKPTLKTYRALVEAARSGDIENLRDVISGQEYPPNVSFGAPDDAVAFLKEISEDGNGRQMLGLMLDLLDQPFSWHPENDGPVYYSWPYLNDLDPNALTPEQEVDAYRLLSKERLDELKDFGAWISWRLMISDDGEWAAFVAGD